MALKSKRTFSAVGIAIALAITVVVVGLTVFPHTEQIQVAPGGPLVSLRGTITVNSESGAGILNLTVFNAANYPFTSIRVSSISPSIPGAVQGIVFSYDGAAVTQSNPLYIGTSAGSVYDFGTGVIPGTAYSIVVTVTQSNGQSVSGSASLTAQA